jgi:hypothetical protein
MEALVCWFAAAPLPEEPFSLFAWMRINHPALYYQALEGDIREGPSGRRSRSGALLADLRRLHGLFG